MLRSRFNSARFLLITVALSIAGAMAACGNFTTAGPKGSVVAAYDAIGEARQMTGLALDLNKITPSDASTTRAQLRTAQDAVDEAAKMVAAGKSVEGMDKAEAVRVGLRAIRAYLISRGAPEPAPKPATPATSGVSS